MQKESISNFPSKFFVTGTDTGIGKTVVSAMLTLGLKARYWKPVQSGLEEQTDTEFVRELTGLGDQYFAEETFRLNEPMSPHASAEIDGVTIHLDDFELPDAGPNGRLIVEGAGGLYVPLNDQDIMTDLIQYFDLPALIVARSELGTLNHTLLSIEHLRNRDIPIIGVIMNGPKHESNRKTIEHFGEVPVIAEIEKMDSLSPETLEDLFNELFETV